MAQISLAESDNDIERCFPVMRELRQHLDKEQFIAQVNRQNKEWGYRLVCLEENGDIKGAAGFRISECLAWGRYLYVDDLAVKEGDRSKGYGGRLLQWLIQHAKEQFCDQLHLDSGIQRLDAHRFYLKSGMQFSSHHFSLRMKSD